MDGLLSELSSFLISQDNVHSSTAQVAKTPFAQMIDPAMMGEVHLYTRSKWVRHLLVLYDRHLVAFKTNPSPETLPVNVLPITSSADAAIVESETFAILHVAAFNVSMGSNRRLKTEETELWKMDTWRIRSSSSELLLEYLMVIEEIIHSSVDAGMVAESAIAAENPICDNDDVEVVSSSFNAIETKEEQESIHLDSSDASLSPISPLSPLSVNESNAKASSKKDSTKPAVSNAKGKQPIRSTLQSSSTSPSRRLSVQVTSSTTPAPSVPGPKSRNPIPVRRGTAIGISVPPSDKGLLRSTLLGQQKQQQQQEAAVRKKRSNSMIDLKMAASPPRTPVRSASPSPTTTTPLRPASAAGMRTSLLSSSTPPSRLRPASFLEK
ncbi:UNVERIFIED_CONTAM: hypothetical protein HDU68_001863 [Siphonaria sp. JEL0065]|nr:hypothetical protein HDU68_001863 [Siphonaria sp. JEL0065]